MWLLAERVVFLVALLTAIGIAIYLLGSYALMRGHTAPRPLQLTWRALAREALWVIVTQPLLPFYYFVGRRMGRVRTSDAGANARPPVVLVHGYMHNRVGFLGLARALARRRGAPIFALNYPFLDSVPKNARRLARFVERIVETTGAREVDLVCHSMGGVVALEMLRAAASGEIVPPPRVRRCVTVASPHAGVAWQGPMLGEGGRNLRRGSPLLAKQSESAVGVPCLSIYSSHDNIVHPKETSHLGARGGRDLEIPEVGHLSILFDRRVADAVVAFLDEP